MPIVSSMADLWSSSSRTEWQNALARYDDVVALQRDGLSEKVILRPGLRFYSQSAARFYYYDLNQTTVNPNSGAPRILGPYYSSDYRLSEFQSFNYGLKVIWKATDRLDLDVALEHYDLRGRDGTTPQSAYSRARVVTLGAKFSW